MLQTPEPAWVGRSERLGIRPIWGLMQRHGNVGRGRAEATMTSWRISPTCCSRFATTFSGASGLWVETLWTERWPLSSGAKTVDPKTLTGPDTRLPAKLALISDWLASLVSLTSQNGLVAGTCRGMAGNSFPWKT